jgi:hypothetical protein
MSAKRNLVDAYGTWEQLTRSEGAAIQNEDWPRVTECQRSKQDLQREIIHLTESAQAECRFAGGDTQNLEHDMRPIINALIALETRNAELLASRRQSAEARRLHLDQAVHNLRRVQKSYAAPAEAVWNSYS